jgi:hypothetical protein
LSTRGYIPVVAASLLLLAAACSRPASARLSDLCGGSSVVQYVTLVVDTLTPRAGPAAQRLVGKRYPLTINLNNILNSRNCEDRSGEGAVIGYLPDVLTAAEATRKQVMRWQIDGNVLRVDLNPGVIDNNLNFTLPLNGKDGRWALATLAGEVGWGRLLADTAAQR